MKSRYCIVIPAFNTAEKIGGLVERVKGQGFSVLVVDDGSTDQTATAAMSQGAVVISHVRNQGKGSALRTGFKYALRSRYDGVVTMDSDGQHDPADIPRLIEEGERQHAGIVIGNRMGRGHMPRVRRWTNWIMSRIISYLSRQDIPDSQCGFRMVRKEVLASVPLTSTLYDIESELLLAASRKRWKMISVHVETIYGNHGSHIRPVRDAIGFIRLVFRYLR